MTALFLRTRTFSDMGDLDRRLYTLPHAPTDTVARVGPDPVKLARNGCMLPSEVRLSLSRYCTHQPHPCTVLTAAHHIHTRPPDLQASLAYQRPLVNTYRMSDLCRPQRARHRQGPRRSFAITRSGAGVDLPGFGRCDSDMSDQDDAPAARGGSGNRARRTAARDDERGQRPWRRSEFPSDDATFTRCRVKSHEDFPRHIYRLFLILGIQFRRVLTRGTLARALVSSAELAIDDPKEQTWMAMYEHDRDTLEDILYRRLQDLWAPLTDSMKVFDTHGSAQQLCAQKVWEGLLTVEGHLGIPVG